MAEHTYALIDGVKRQSAIKDLYKSGELIQLIPLYIGSPFQDNYDLGPILVAYLNESVLTNKMKNKEWSESTTFITSNQTLSIVADHLRQFITVTDETKTQTIFRFADPLVTWYWLNSYDCNERTSIFGPITTWQIKQPQSSYLKESSDKWDLFTKEGNNKLKHDLDFLAEPQVKALEDAYEFRLKEKLYSTLCQLEPHFFNNASGQEIEQWLNNRLSDAKKNYVTSEQTLAMWMLMCCEFGNDFMTAPTGHYQMWLTENSDYKKLPTDIILQTYFDQRPKITTITPMEG